MISDTHPRLTAAIYEACPELMELTFGCRVRHGDEDTMRWVHFGPDFGNFDGPDCHQFIMENYNGTRVFDSRIEAKSVIGHEIRLEHVLRTLHEARRGKTLFVVTMSGVFFEESNEMPLAKWDTAKPLSGQSSQALDFLEGVICGEDRK